MNGSSENNNKETAKETVIVKTDIDSKDGQNKCPKCGSTDITLNTNEGKLQCQFCRHEFEAEKVSGMVEDISSLEGQVMGSGAQDIIADTNDVLTFKCTSCGAEVVIDTASASSARCHWCRNTLSVNQQIPNGAIPDVVLPFNITKDVAKNQINTFVGKRKFYAHPKFKKEFTTENIMGVYFPYMIVDVNSHSKLIGEAEKKVRSYVVKNNNSYTTYYDADVYEVKREFDLSINGLTVESNSDRLNSTASDKTNNIINSIMPFDVENSVKYDANYLKGYTSEKRDVNVEQLKKQVDIQSQDIARFAANDSLKEYDRGVKWQTEGFDIKGQQWKAAYLPVWLYSYQQVSGNKKLLHYVAVNARTKETMGSVPIHIPKLVFISFLVELLGILGIIVVDFDYEWAFLLVGFIYYFIIYGKYRNKSARHFYEKETTKEVRNLVTEDKYVTQRKGLTSAYISGVNNTSVKGTKVKESIFKDVKISSPVVDIVKKNIIDKR